MRLERTLLKIPKRFIPLMVLSYLVLFAPAAEANTAIVHGKTNCGQGAELRLSSPRSSQGSLLLVELRTAKPLNEIKGEWTGKETLFWMAQAPAKARYFLYRALLGVDLEQ